MSPTLLRAMIVDDEPPARTRLRHLLESSGGVTIVTRKTAVLPGLSRPIWTAAAPIVESPL